MHEELKEEAIVNKVGGRFKLSTLIQKRLVQLNQGSRPLVDGAKDKMTIVLQEILQDKIFLDTSNNVRLLGMPGPNATPCWPPRAPTCWFANPSPPILSPSPSSRPPSRSQSPSVVLAPSQSVSRSDPRDSESPNPPSSHDENYSADRSC